MKKKWPPSFLTEAKLLRLLLVRIAGPDVNGPVSRLRVVPFTTPHVPYNFICVVWTSSAAVGGVKFCLLAFIIMLSAACDDKNMRSFSVAVH